MALNLFAIKFFVHNCVKRHVCLPVDISNISHSLFVDFFLVENEDELEINDVVFRKPFVEEASLGRGS